MGGREGRVSVGMVRAAAVAVAVAVMGLVVAAPSAAEVTPTAEEVLALLAIRAELRDPNNALRDWVANSGSTPCRWKRVTCSDGIIVGLELGNLNLSGTLSPEIAKLRRLQNVYFDHNAITGAIPNTIVQLPLLQRLDLSHNRLNGSIPDALGYLRGLLYLDVSYNNISGYIPYSLATSRSLYILDISYNNLSGEVPVFSVRNVLFIGNPLLSHVSCGETCGYRLVTEDLNMPVQNPLSKTDDCPVSFPVNSKTVIYLAGALVVVSFFGGIILVCSQWRRHPEIFDDIDDKGVSDVCFGHVKRYMLKEIQEATDNFNPKNILGRGGYSIVFKGILHDGTIVAVKRSKEIISASGEDRFHTEVEVISLVVHRHLLSLIGFCSEDNERILVYPYMPNGTVSSKLREYVSGRPALDWARRKKVALGTARGLVHLHEQCDPKIIHRDIKASNILLDDYFEAVVADFGLAKLLNHGQSHIHTVVRGTFGRISPEYLMLGKSSEKSDIFAYGYLLIELITGRRTFDIHEDEYSRGGILDWAKELLETDQLSTIVDKNLGDDYATAEMAELVQIALLCTMYNPVHRPSISEVVKMLEGDGTVAERWEVVKDVSTSMLGTPTGVMTPANYEGDELVSVDMEAIELSGPRAEMRDTNSALRDWVANSCSTPCRWKSVTCSDGVIVGLEMRNLNLSGTLLPEIVKLRRLQNVYFDHNAMTRVILDTIVQLPLLQRLDMSHNRLNGSIPDALGYLRGLLYVDVSYNNISGYIPCSLATSRSLYIMDISYNNLSGELLVFSVRNVLFIGNPLLKDVNCGETCGYRIVAEDLAMPVQNALNQPVSFPVNSTSSR